METLPRGDTTILLPTLNEASAVGGVIDGFRAQGYDTVVVIDGGSTDGTRDAATDHGATVIQQNGSGKGQAVRQAFQTIETPFVIMADADATYDPADADVMLKPLATGEADHTIGNRFAMMDDDAMSLSHRAANYALNNVFRGVHRMNFGDILSGYHGFNKAARNHIDITEEGFGVEAQMAVQSAHRPLRTVVVPIQYHARAEDTESEIRPVHDFMNILRVILTKR